MYIFQDGDNTIISYRPGLEYTKNNTLLSLQMLNKIDLESKQDLSGHILLFK